MVYIHPSLKRLLMRKSFNICFKFVFNICDYMRNNMKTNMKKNKLVIKL